MSFVRAMRILPAAASPVVIPVLLTVITRSGDCPTEISQQVSALHCHHIRWGNITADKLRPYVHLKLLDLSMGTISQIADDAFAAMKQLQVLNLSNTDLRLIPRDAFSECPQLEVLDLSHNALVLPASGPILSSSSLQALDLSHCSLSQLPEGALSMLPNLTELRLRGNPNLERLPKCLLHVNATINVFDADHMIQATVGNSSLNACENHQDSTESDKGTHSSEIETVTDARERANEIDSENNVVTVTVYVVSTLSGGVFASLIAYAIYYCCCRHKKKKNTPTASPDGGNTQICDESHVPLTL